MSRLGKIILDSNYPNPYIIISDSSKYPRGLRLVANDGDIRKLKLSNEAITIINYRGKKLEDRSVDLTNVHGIYNLKIREIGVLSEEEYCRVLRNFVSYHAAMGASDPAYLGVREEVHKQLIKMMEKGIYGA